MISIVRSNAEKDPTYCPYCMRCSGLVRMKKIEHLYWECVQKGCTAVHDEREGNENRTDPTRDN
jgi:hypothetical protein